MAKASKTHKGVHSSTSEYEQNLKIFVDENGEPFIYDNDPEIVPPPEEELEITPPNVPPPPAEGP